MHCCVIINNADMVMSGSAVSVQQRIGLVLSYLYL